ncbi:right-handed parallel beta-helix repeat-containing protein [Verrucomicrobiaceae bacterium N1E253]|uniref:Right-handed parallel beta-helix repeat-containing protein n=2 Tax=Oceaniferula marina TaxID=2748318 RepID=A0A851GFF1_9BACT|nr:right-handed parallel beta-helix repeat-containing protein [Oceaniferula marina]
MRMEGGWQDNRRTGPHKTYRYVENIFEELDTAYEWFLDRDKSVLYVYPPEGVDLSSAVISVTPIERESILRFEGSREQSVKNLCIKGITFSATARTFMKTKEPLLRSDWAIYRNGAVYFKGSEDCQVHRCHFTQLGGNAIFIDGYNQRIDVRSCLIENIGASAVCAVGDTKAVYNGLYKPYGPGVSAKDMIWKRGAKTEDYPRSIQISDNLIFDIGRIEKQSAGVHLSVAYGVSVQHNSIYNVPRAGINISEGAFGGHDIAYNDVFDTVMETNDHGAFNSWGRDRYWWSRGIDLSKRHETVLLDCMKPTTIRNNRWKCEHGWDIDLDDGSSHYIITNNVCLSGGIKLREGFHRIARNNICVGKRGLDFHAWYRNSYDVVSQNIVFAKHHVRKNAMKHWGALIDYNFFAPTAAKDPRFVHIDKHSVTGEPLFLDPKNLDFRIQPDSLAYAVGFQNFDMNGFGVVSSHLRAMAKRPEFDGFPEPEEKEVEPVAFEGMLLRDIENLSDLSATGMGEKKGAWLLEKTSKLDPRWSKLEDFDVIVSLNAQPVNKVKDLIAIAGKLQRGKPIEAEIFRKQKQLKIRLD